MHLVHLRSVVQVECMAWIVRVSICLKNLAKAAQNVSRIGRIGSDQIRSVSHYSRLDQIRSDQIRSDQIRSDDIRSDQIRSHHITSDHIRSDHIRSHQVRSGQIRSDQIRSDHIRSDQSRSDSEKCFIHWTDHATSPEEVVHKTSGRSRPPALSQDLDPSGAGT